ncbi:MAG TPA: MFS transporter [Candidatus Sulfotelmatobacter sp.]|nr:MFS transporter [Candidatus Sulfotelmatobacter sp.]
MTKRAVLGLAGAGLFVAALDAYVVVTLLPAMMGDVGLTIDRIEQATPIVTGFLAGYVVAMPLLGAYSDARGRVPVYVACIAAFAVGSVMTATAGLWTFADLGWLVAGRFVQGLGGGGLVPLSLALAADLYTRGRSRTIALGSVAALQEAGSVFGPLYGATLAAAAAGLGGWRFVFWLNLALATACGAALVLAARGGTTAGQPAAASIDWRSAALLGLGLGSLVLALYPDDPDHRATNALLIPAGAAAIVLMAGYAWRQMRTLEPLIPRELLRSGVFIGATVANLLIGAALMVALVDVPILGRLVFTLDQLGSGLLLTQFLIGVPIGAVAGGWLAGRIGTRLTAALGILVSAVAFLQMSGWSATELSLRVGPLRQADVALALCGLGFGLVIAPLTAAVLGLTRAQSHGLATSLVVLARTMGMLIGLSALTAYGLHRFHQILGNPVLHGTDVHSRVLELENLVAAAFLQEYREIFQIAAVLCVIAAAVSAFSLPRASRSGDSGTRRPGPQGSP